MEPVGARTFVRAPRGTHGVAHKAMIVQLLAAYGEVYPGLIPAMEAVEVLET